MRSRHLLAALCACSLGGCTNAGAPSAGGAPVTGLWGGSGAGLVLTDSGGTISYDCAHGSLRVVQPDHAGRFDVGGTHVRERGGPTRVGETLASVPARYLGEVNGQRLRLRAVVGNDTLGPFGLVRGAPPQLVRCL